MSTERVTITLDGKDEGAKALVSELRAQIDKLNASGEKGADVTRRGGVAARDAAKGFEQLHGWIKAIAAAEVVRGLVELTKRGIETAVSLNKMSEQTGVSVEKLSALKYAADQNETSLEALVPAFRALSKNLQDLNEGSPEAVKTFNAIGLSAKDFKGLSLDQSLKLVADRLNEYEDGADKVAVSQGLLGRSAIELLPLLKSLAGEGLAKMTKEAEGLGLVMSSDTARAADELDDKMTALRASITAALTPDAQNLDRITQFLDDLVRKGEDGASSLDHIGSALTRLVSSLPFGLGQIIATQSKINEIIHQFDDVSGGASSTAGGAPKKKPIPTADLAALKASIAARVAALQQEAQVIALDAKNADALNQAAFDKGLESLRTYYVVRRSIINRESQNEISVLEKTRAAIASQSTVGAEAIAQKQQIAAIDGQIYQKRIQTTAALTQLSEDERKAQKKLADDIVGFQQTILNAEGKTLQATLLGINKKIDADRILLAQSGLLTKDAEAQLGVEQRLLTQRAQFNDLASQSDRVFSDIARQRQDIETRAATGLISQREAEREIAELEQSRVPVLQQLAAEMLAFAEAVGDPALIESAKNLSASIGSLGIERSTKAAAVAMANFRDDAIQALGSDLSQFLGSGINQVHSFADAWRSLALSAVQSIQQIIAQLIALRIVQAATGFFAGLSSAGAAGPTVGVTPQDTSGLGFNSPLAPLGGLRSLNVTPLSLRDFSSLSLSQFSGAPRAAVGPSGTESLVIEVVASDDHVVRVMKSPEGAKVHVRHTSNNKKAINQVLGR